MTDVNNNLKYVLSTDILAFALFDNAKVGLASGHFSGDGYVGELPDPQIKYGTFEINRRNAGSISIKCFDIDQIRYGQIPIQTILGRVGKRLLQLPIQLV